MKSQTRNEDLPVQNLRVSSDGIESKGVGRGDFQTEGSPIADWWAAFLFVGFILWLVFVAPWLLLVFLVPALILLPFLGPLVLTGSLPWLSIWLSTSPPTDVSTTPRPVRGGLISTVLGVSSGIAAYVLALDAASRLSTAPLILASFAVLITYVVPPFVLHLNFRKVRWYSPISLLKGYVIFTSFAAVFWLVLGWLGSFVRT